MEQATYLFLLALLSFNMLKAVGRPLSIKVFLRTTPPFDV